MTVYPVAMPTSDKPRLMLSIVESSAGGRFKKSEFRLALSGPQIEKCYLVKSIKGLNVMPRKTTGALHLIASQTRLIRVKPPSTLSQAERAAFLEIVSNSAPQHFQASDVPLLSRYVEALVLAERAARELRGEAAVVNGKPNPWLHVQEKALRAIVALSMRLRLSPQGRKPNSAAPKLVTPASAYENMETDDE